MKANQERPVADGLIRLRRLGGRGGAAALDAEAVVNALVALGRIAEDLADTVQSIDVNPFVVLPRGGFALDALVVPHVANTSNHQ